MLDLTEYDLEYARIRSLGVRARRTWSLEFNEESTCDIAALINHRRTDSDVHWIASVGMAILLGKYLSTYGRVGNNRQ